jgi:hypothetical protein
MLAGELAAADYRRAMARLAAQDEIRYPRTVPPDPGR